MAFVVQVKRWHGVASWTWGAGEPFHTRFKQPKGRRILKQVGFKGMLGCMVGDRLESLLHF